MRVSIKNTILYWIIAILLLSGIVYLVWQTRFKQEQSTSNYQVDLVHQVDSLLYIDTSKAEKLLKQFLPKDNDHVNTQDLAYMYIYKMSILVDKNQTDSIPYYASKALTYTHETPNEDLQNKLNNAFGKYYRLIGDYPNSLLYSLKGLSLKNNDDLNMMNIYNNLGGVYFELDDIDKAIEYFEKLYAVANKVNDKKRLAVAEGNLGSAYLLKNDYLKAKEYLNKSKTFFETNRDTLNVIKICTTLSKLELQQKNYAQAHLYLKRAEELCMENEDAKVALGLVYQHYGNFFLKQQKYDLSKQYYNKVYNLSIEKKIPRDQLNAMFGLRDVNMATKNFQEAFSNQNEYYKLRDSIYGIKMQQKMEEIKWSSELEDQRIQNKLLQGKYEAEQQRKSILTILYLIVIVSIVSFATLFYMNSKKSLRISKLTNEKLEERVLAEQQMKEIQEQQFQQELEVKNQELIALNILILAKNKIFSEVENIIEKEDNEEVITELKRKVKSNKNQEKDWDKFKTIFEKTHPNFYQTIDEKYPQLSKTEVRICSYIKIAMPKGEICAMMNINHSSLIKTRYRIRKKLNLESTDDLDEFVRSW
ncbi:MAG: tetratricopeptide repeat protein [Flavobacteriaceae bacterium]|jgi:tetratricopeptide (TPR) repeat protein|nr:tetratricopeptide repeat protein [Flavobacteriaceae bacterium]